jgi:hypothetical protein
MEYIDLLMMDQFAVQSTRLGRWRACWAIRIWADGKEGQAPDGEVGRSRRGDQRTGVDWITHQLVQAMVDNDKGRG